MKEIIRSYLDFRYGSLLSSRVAEPLLTFKELTTNLIESTSNSNFTGSAKSEKIYTMPPKTTKQHSKQQKPSLVQDPEQQASEMTEDELTTDANASEVVPTSVLQSMQVDFG